MRWSLVLVPLLGCRPPAPAAEPVAPTRTLTLVAMNDFHGSLYEEPYRGEEGRVLGGLPWLVGAVEALRAEAPGLVLLDGGDLFQGSWPVNATEGRGSVEAMNLLGLDASAVGNHEFDYGPLEGQDPGALRGALEAGAKQADFAWLTANVYDGDGRWAPEGIAPWTTIERDGLEIAVVGLSTADTPQTTLLANVADLEFRDVVQAVREVLPEVTASDPDVTVLVAHLTGSCDPAGYLELGEPCTPDGEVGRLLTELPEGTFDVMVLGHAHTLLAHRVGDTFLLENRAHGHALGRVDLVVGPDGVDADASTLHEPWPLVHAPADPGCEAGEYALAPQEIGGRTVTPSAEAVALVEALEAEAGSLCTEVGCAARLLTRSRTEESDIGNLVSDAIAWKFPEAQIAVQNSGGLRANLPEGTLRREQLQAVMPFDNRLVVVEMTGQQVERMFRLGSSGAHGILQVAGAAYHFDPTVTTGTDLDEDGAVADWERDRLCAVTVGGEPLDPEATYRVVTTDFLYGGGDHLGPAFADTVVVEQGPLLREVLFEYVGRQETCLGTTPLVDPAAPRIRLAACSGK